MVVGVVESGTELQVTQDEANLTSHWSTGKNVDAAANILNRVLIKVRANGADRDGKRLRVWARELSDTYAEFLVTMGLGNNVAAIFTGPDLNNTTAAATIATWTDIVNTEGYQEYDISGNGANEPYYSKWDKASRTAIQLYERTKWIARRGTSESIHSVNGQLFSGITHQFDYDGEVAAFTEDAVLAWGTSFAYDGGTGTVPAVGQYWVNSTAGGRGKVVHVNPGAGATGTVVIQREATTPAWSDNDVFALLGGTGSITVAGAVTGDANTGGSAILLALDDNGTAGTCWVQLVSGAIGANNYQVWQRGSTGYRADQNGAATSRTIRNESKSPPCVMVADCPGTR